MKTDCNDLNSLWTETAIAFYDSAAEKEKAASLNNTFVKSYSTLLNNIAVKKDSKILDLGCGLGRITGAIGPYCSFVIGIDISYKSLLHAKQFYPESPFLRSNIDQIPLKNKSFDLITAVTSLEHCYNKHGALAQIGELLKNNGQVYIEVRNLDFVLFRILNLLGFRYFHSLFVKPYPAESFRDLRYQEWLDLFTASGFVLIDVISSLRPWRTGGFIEKVKNLMILAIRHTFPIRLQYMAGFILKKKVSP